MVRRAVGENQCLANSTTFQTLHSTKSTIEDLKAKTGPPSEIVKDTQRDDGTDILADDRIQPQPRFRFGKKIAGALSITSPSVPTTGQMLLQVRDQTRTAIASGI
jgi:hypothetical protein